MYRDGRGRRELKTGKRVVNKPRGWSGELKGVQI